MSDLKPSTYLSKRFTSALEYAIKWHQDEYHQVRKSTSLNYLCHPMGVASLVLEAGGDEDQAIAALLHDVPEDCGGESRLAEILADFGPRVEKIVRECSDSLVDEIADKAPWRERKQTHIDHIAHADPATLLVVAADKLHNGRAIVMDLSIQKAKVWDRFNAWDLSEAKERIPGTCSTNVHWYYNSMYQELKKRAVSASVLNPLKDVVDVLKSHVGE
jgi:(p)ppGpp synthase/HD superfamily hydrolase